MGAVTQPGTNASPQPVDARIENPCLADYGEARDAGSAIGCRR